MSGEHRNSKVAKFDVLFNEYEITVFCDSKLLNQLRALVRAEFQRLDDTIYPRTIPGQNDELMIEAKHLKEAYDTLVEELKLERGQTESHEKASAAFARDAEVASQQYELKVRVIDSVEDKT